MKTRISRRTVLSSFTGAALLSVFPRRADAEGLSKQEGLKRRRTSPVREFKLESKKAYTDPFWDVQLDALITTPDGRHLHCKQSRFARRARIFRPNHQIPLVAADKPAALGIPAFWSGGSVWRWRFWDPQPGTYRYKTIASDTGNSDLHGVMGEFQIDKDTGGNFLFHQGALQVSANHRYLETARGTPFLWLGDTWWMGLTERLAWPEQFKQLASDRRDKGFNVVQLVAGRRTRSFGARFRDAANRPRRLSVDPQHVEGGRRSVPPRANDAGRRS